MTAFKEYMYFEKCSKKVSLNVRRIYFDPYLEKKDETKWPTREEKGNWGFPFFFEVEHTKTDFFFCLQNVTEWFPMLLTCDFYTVNSSSNEVGTFSGGNWKGLILQFTMLRMIANGNYSVDRFFLSSHAKNIPFYFRPPKTV